jgi:hypothetical protein
VLPLWPGWQKSSASYLLGQSLQGPELCFGLRMVGASMKAVQLLGWQSFPQGSQGPKAGSNSCHLRTQSSSVPTSHTVKGKINLQTGAYSKCLLVSTIIVCNSATMLNSCPSAPGRGESLPCVSQ